MCEQRRRGLSETNRFLAQASIGWPASMDEIERLTAENEDLRRALNGPMEGLWDELDDLVPRIRDTTHRNI